MGIPDQTPDQDGDDTTARDWYIAVTGRAPVVVRCAWAELARLSEAAEARGLSVGVALGEQAPAGTRRVSLAALRAAVI